MIRKSRNNMKLTRQFILESVALGHLDKDMLIRKCLKYMSGVQVHKLADEIVREWQAGQ
jgi:hypothetical protein